MKVLISRPDKIGDVVLALHAVKQLKRLMPHLEVFLHVSAYTVPLVERIRFVDGFVSYGEELEPYHFDAVVDLIAKPYTSKEYYKAKIPVRIGNAARWFRFRYNRSCYLRRSCSLMNEAEYNWRLMSLLDPSLLHSRLIDSLDADDITDLPPSPVDEVHTVLMPGVAVSAKPWPFERWIELIRELSEKSSDPILIIGGPAEREFQVPLQRGLEGVDNVQLQFFEKLDEVMALLKSAKRYVGCSTGISHLAAAMSCEGALLYPRTRSMHPRRWEPFRHQMKVLSPIETVTPLEVVQTLASDDESWVRDRSPVSAFVICKNEEEHIRTSLDSIRWCDEIVLIDSGSTDATLSIVREEFPRVRIIERHWPGHRAQKQFGLESCSHSWVLNIDADEEVSGELKGTILQMLERDLNSPVLEDGFRICRVVHFLGRWWNRGGWYPEYRLRLVRREKTSWGGVDPHEKAMAQGKTSRMRGDLHHYSFRDFDDYIQTLQHFSTLSARSMFREGRKPTFSQVLLRPFFRFVKFFILKRGFLEGRAGYVVARAESYYAYLKYMKLWELTQDWKEPVGILRSKPNTVKRVTQPKNGVEPKALQGAHQLDDQDQNQSVQ